MSRENVENDRYQMAFGVDHAIGCFFQIWEKVAKKDEGDTPQLSASEQFGFAINDAKTLERNDKLRGVFNHLGHVRYLRSEETIIAIGKALGFDITKEVYKLWD